MCGFMGAESNGQESWYGLKRGNSNARVSTGGLFLWRVGQRMRAHCEGHDYASCRKTTEGVDS